MPLLSATHKIGSEGGVPLLFSKRSDVGVAHVIFEESENVSSPLFPPHAIKQIYIFIEINVTNRFLTGNLTEVTKFEHT